MADDKGTDTKTKLALLILGLGALVGGVAWIAWYEKTAEQEAKKEAWAAEIRNAKEILKARENCASGIDMTEVDGVIRACETIPGTPQHEAAEAQKLQEACKTKRKVMRLGRATKCEEIPGTDQYERRQSIIAECDAQDTWTLDDGDGSPPAKYPCDILPYTKQGRAAGGWPEPGAAEGAMERALERIEQSQGRKIRCENFAIDCLENDVRACLDFERLC